MSIKGIDTQIMVQRTADTVKDVSQLQKHPETSQEAIADRTKAESIFNQSAVQQTQESEMQNIRTDVDGGNAGAGGGGGQNGEEEEDTEDVPPELIVAPAAIEQIIDIMI